MHQPPPVRATKSLRAVAPSILPSTGVLGYGPSRAIVSWGILAGRFPRPAPRSCVRPRRDRCSGLHLGLFRVLESIARHVQFQNDAVMDEPRADTAHRSTSRGWPPSPARRSTAASLADAVPSDAAPARASDSLPCPFLHRLQEVVIGSERDRRDLHLDHRRCVRCEVGFHGRDRGHGPGGRVAKSRLPPSSSAWSIASLIR